MEILVWEKEQALFYYTELVGAVSDVAHRKQVQAQAFRRTARALVPGVPIDSAEDYPVAWGELPIDQLPAVVGFWLEAETHHSQGFILGRKAEALRKLLSKAKDNFKNIKPL